MCSHHTLLEGRPEATFELGAAPCGPHRADSRAPSSQKSGLRCSVRRRPAGRRQRGASTSAAPWGDRGAPKPQPDVKLTAVNEGRLRARARPRCHVHSSQRRQDGLSVLRLRPLQGLGAVFLDTLGGGGADNSHATEDLSFPSTVHEFRGRVCGGGGGGGVVFLVNLGSPQFLVPFRIVISTFKTLGNNQRLAFHFRETGLWVNCTFYFRTD